MRRLLVLPLVAVVALLAAGASNAGRVQMTLTCTGGIGPITVTVTNTTNNHSVAWGTGKASNQLKGIPVSFTGAFIDLNTGTGLASFTQAKGKGHGMHRQPTVTCTTPPQTGTAADFGITGVDPATPVEFDFSAQVVIKQHRH